MSTTKKQSAADRIKALTGVPSTQSMHISTHIEKSKVKSTGGKKGGARVGAGRKPGGKNPETLEKERVLAAYRQKILRSADKLFQSQMSLAVGTQLLYCITTRTIGRGKNARTERSKPELVTDPETIEAYLAGDFEDMSENEFYFITTKEPNNAALDSLTNRVFGKPAQPLSGDENDPIVLRIDF